ncbi:helix-turn-helix domain-containing protein, partial [Pseudomonas sp.]|uniref:helix-turn-helix domain-containing protein n=1 Tax=Pseudomonas sp. TaxID=306 RepID=UPI0028AA68BC
VIERALITSEGLDLRIDLPVGVAARSVVAAEPESPAAPAGILTDAQVRQLERDNLKAALQAAGGKLFGKNGAAELLGLKPTTLASRLKRLELG